MKTAKRIYQQYPDVVFMVVGSDRICYGGDEKHIQHKTFREHVLAQENYDLSRSSSPERFRPGRWSTSLASATCIFI